MKLQVSNVAIVGASLATVTLAIAKICGVAITWWGVFVPILTVPAMTLGVLGLLIIGALALLGIIVAGIVAISPLLFILAIVFAIVEN